MEKKAYQELGWNTANVPFYHKYLCKPIEKMLPTDGSPLLDIGCGNRCFANYLNKKGYCVYGIDASVQGIEIANRVRGKNERRFFVNNVTKAEWPAELQTISFKTVLSMEVIEHLYNSVAYYPSSGRY